jgi:hypothetical protein
VVQKNNNNSWPYAVKGLIKPSTADLNNNISRSVAAPFAMHNIE